MRPIRVSRTAFESDSLLVAPIQFIAPATKKPKGTYYFTPDDFAVGN